MNPANAFGAFGYRVFTDSAPVLEVALAEKAGLGWRGKHTLLLSRDAGSWFFLGEIYTDLPLPVDQPSQNHCGTCKACIDICPTQAIVAGDLENKDTRIAEIVGTSEQNARQLTSRARREVEERAKAETDNIRKRAHAEMSELVFMNDLCGIPG